MTDFNDKQIESRKLVTNQAIDNTTKTWLSLFNNENLSSVKIIESVHPKSGELASIIMLDRLNVNICDIFS